MTRSRKSCVSGLNPNAGLDTDGRDEILIGCDWSCCWICCVKPDEAGMDDGQQGVACPDHSKWIEKLRATFVNGDLPRFNMLGQQYDTWCQKNSCVMEDLGLEDINLPAASTSTSQAVSQGTSGNATKLFATKAPVKISIVASLGHSLPLLSQYFDAAMRNKTIYVPWTVLDKRWLELDANFLRSKTTKVSCTVKVLVYNRSRVPNEWQQSFMDWLLAGKLFVCYWREVKEVYC